MTVRAPRRWLWAAGLALLPLLGLAAFYAALHGHAALLPPIDMPALDERSAIVVDRNGKLLRPFAMENGRWRLPVSAKDVDPRYLAMLVAYEDKRFFSHGGVDARALARAGWQIVRARRVISGGSTLSMQVARLVEPRESRSLACFRASMRGANMPSFCVDAFPSREPVPTSLGNALAVKWRQMARAIALEKQFGKEGLLNLYLSLAPFGGNLEGVRAAALAYFGREPNRLSTAEAALLVALPQSPEQRRPDRFGKAAQKARDGVLARIAQAGVLPVADIARAGEEAMPSARHPFPMHAAHRAEALLAETPKARRVETTFDRDWQANLANLARERAEALGPKLSVAIVVIEHASGQVRASIGGAEYLAADRAGGMDLTRAIRSPGSALKPFIYALAFEEGIAHPETMLEDRPMRFSTYAPENFDPGFQGMVSARQALQMSLNLPAVDLLSSYGPQRFLSRLKDAGAEIHLPKATPSGEGAAPGLAIALGGLGITLHDLTTLFAGLARGGEMFSARETAAPPPAPTSIVGPVAAWYVAETLRFAPPPDNGASGRIAFKTGTSYGYRDAFAIGFDRRHTIGVWVGRADNAAVPGLVGRKVAAPILFDAFARIGLQPGVMARPKDALMSTNATLPPPLRHLRKDAPKTLASLYETPLTIAFPPDGARVELNEGEATLALKFQGGSAPFTVLIDGEAQGESLTRRNFVITPRGLGFSDIAVVDAKGATARARVRLQ